MGVMSKHNNHTQRFAVDTEGFEYVSLKQIAESLPDLSEVLPLRGLYINKKSKFGEAPVAILDNCFANLPGWQLETVYDILEDPDAIRAINAGEAGIQIFTFVSKLYGKTCYGVEFCDM